MYCSHMIYKYYSCLVFFLIKHNEEVKDIYNEIFNNIPHFIKNHLPVDCLQDVFVMYNNKVKLCKIEVIPVIHDSVIPVDCCKKNPSLILQPMT